MSCRESCLCSTCIHGYNDICDNCGPCEIGERGQKSCGTYKYGKDKLMKELVDIELVYSCGHKKRIGIISCLVKNMILNKKEILSAVFVI